MFSLKLVLCVCIFFVIGIEAEPKPIPKAEPKPQPKAEPKPKPKAEPKPQPKAEPKPYTLYNRADYGYDYMDVWRMRMRERMRERERRRQMRDIYGNDYISWRNRGNRGLY